MWEEGGNQREQRGLETDNKPSVQSGLPPPVGGLALVTASLCGGWGVGREAASLQERLLPLAVC